ncbi:hypothetical protein HIR70_08890, partial [Pasteurella multocida]|nr:hypothetical protein [Pasteurella multocida]NMR62865.1 hypothetical protein [Pasteurella multocida]
NIVKTTVFVQDLNAFAAFKAEEERVVKEKKPARGPAREGGEEEGVPKDVGIEREERAGKEEERESRERRRSKTITFHLLWAKKEEKGGGGGGGGGREKNAK